MTQHRVERRHRMLALAAARERVGEQRPSQPRRQLVDCGRLDAGPAADDDHAPLAIELGGHRSAHGDAARHRQRRPDRFGYLPDLAEQRLAERQVEMDRPGARRRERPLGERPPRHRIGFVGHRCVAEPPHRAPVQLDLVDRLRGADAAQLGRSVGGEHEHRHLREAGLDHGRVEVGGSGAARAQQCGGHTVEPEARVRRTPPPARRARRAARSRAAMPAPGPSACSANRARSPRAARRSAPTRRPSWRTRWRSLGRRPRSCCTTIGV